MKKYLKLSLIVIGLSASLQGARANDVDRRPIPHTISYDELNEQIKCVYEEENPKKQLERVISLDDVRRMQSTSQISGSNDHEEKVAAQAYDDRNPQQRLFRLSRELFQAIEALDSDQVSVLIEQGVNVYICNEKGKTPYQILYSVVVDRLKMIDISVKKQEKDLNAWRGLIESDIELLRVGRRFDVAKVRNVIDQDIAMKEADIRSVGGKIFLTIEKFLLITKSLFKAYADVHKESVIALVDRYKNFIYWSYEIHFELDFHDQGDKVLIQKEVDAILARLLYE